MKQYTFTIFSLFALVVVACGEKSNLDLERNRAKWNEHKISHYRFTLDIGCYCSFSDLMPASVEVQNGSIVSLIDSTGDLFDKENHSRIEKVATIEKLFSVIERGITDEDEIETDYNSEYGFPTLIKIDWSKREVDGGLSYSVTDFEIIKEKLTFDDILEKHKKETGLDYLDCGKIKLDYAEECENNIQQSKCIADSFSSCTPATLRYISPTIEGDPIISVWFIDSSVNNICQITEFKDTSHDEFKGDYPYFVKYECKSIGYIPISSTCTSTIVKATECTDTKEL